MYPAGIVLKTEKGCYYLNKDNKRYRIISQAILDSWAYPLLVDTSEAALANYPIAFTKLGFRDGTLLHNGKSGKLYLVSGQRRRPVASLDVLHRLGLTEEDAVIVSDEEIAIMKLGDEVR